MDSVVIRTCWIPSMSTLAPQTAGGNYKAGVVFSGVVVGGARAERFLMPDVGFTSFTSRKCTDDLD